LRFDRATKFPLTAEEAAHVDEDRKIEQWGRGEIVLERRASHFAELRAAARVLQSL